MRFADVRTIAQRLGLPQEAVREVQRHGFLRRLDLGEREIRERLWRAHLAFLKSAQNVPGSRGGERRGTTGARLSPGVSPPSWHPPSPRS